MTRRCLFHVGINLLILGSMVPAINYLFYCSLHLKTLYISILVVLSVASMIGTSSVACSKPKCRPFKAVLFIALGLYGKNGSFVAVLCQLLSHRPRGRACFACLSTSRFTTNVPNGFSLHVHHGRDLHHRWCRLCCQSSGTILSG